MPGGAVTTFARSLAAVSTWACAAAVLAACSSTLVLNTGDVQESISQGLSDQAGGTFAVVCPSTAPAEKGFVFTCTASDATDGSAYTVTVTQVDDAGAFTWDVVDPAPASPTPAGPTPSGSGG
jgi:hypothetical protein